MTLDPNHPRIPFSFYVYEAVVDDEDARRMRQVVERLAASRQWSIAPPEFFDSVEPPFNPGKDRPVRRVGGTVDVYSALPPWRERLPRDVDQRNLSEVEDVVREVSELSAESGRTIAFQLGGVDVGWITKGQADRLLLDGLLKPWRSALNMA
jgi:hypothetical protein